MTGGCSAGENPRMASFKGLTGDDVRRGSFCCGWLAKRLDSEFDYAGHLVEMYLGLASFKRVKIEFCRRADFDFIYECSKRWL